MGRRGRRADPALRGTRPAPARRGGAGDGPDDASRATPRTSVVGGRPTRRRYPRNGGGGLMAGSDAILIGEDWISEHFFTTDATSQSFQAWVVARRKAWDEAQAAARPAQGGG